MCVNDTNTVGKLLAINRTYLYSRQLFHHFFRVDKLVFDVRTVGKLVLATVNQSKHMRCSHDLQDTSQNGGCEDECATFQFIEEIQNCPDLWDVSSSACSKGQISTDIRFRPKLSIIPALSVSSPVINIQQDQHTSGNSS